MYRMIVCDFDKTLIDDDLAIPISTVLTIDEIRRKNYKFTVATGRGINYILDYIKDVNFIDYIISLNGSYIYDVINEKVIYEKSITKTIIKKIISKYKKNYKICLYTDHSKCVLENASNDEIIIRDITDFLKNNKIYKVEIHTKTSKQRKELKNQIDEMNLNINTNLQEYTKEDYLVEFTANNISKYTATIKISKKEKIKNEEIIAIGDSYNDIELIKNVGYGVSMDNAIKEVKKVAKKNTLSNNKKGVENILKEIFINKKEG